jgi:hypothetical protein
MSGRMGSGGGGLRGGLGFGSRVFEGRGAGLKEGYLNVRYGLYTSKIHVGHGVDAGDREGRWSTKHCHMLAGYFGQGVIVAVQLAEHILILIHVGSRIRDISQAYIKQHHVICHRTRVVSLRPVYGPSRPGCIPFHPI